MSNKDYFLFQTTNHPLSPKLEIAAYPMNVIYLKCLIEQQKYHRIFNFITSFISLKIDCKRCRDKQNLTNNCGISTNNLNLKAKMH